MRVDAPPKPTDGHPLAFFCSRGRRKRVGPQFNHAAPSALFRRRLVPIEAPHAGSAVQMSQDIAERLQLVLAISDGLGAGSLGPQAALFGAEAVLADEVRRVLFGQADPMPWVVIGEASQNVEVPGVQGNDQYFDAVALQSLCDGIGDELAQLGRDAHRVPLHQSLGEFVQNVVFAVGRRMFVIAVDVLAMVE